MEFLGLCVQNLIISLKYLFKGEGNWKSVLAQASAISYDSLPISLMIVLIAAIVMTIQVANGFAMSGADTYIGGSVAIVIIREVAPGFVALAIGARAGTSICAEIANMKVTSQVDAIKTLKIDPVGYYFAPRIISAMITVPMVVLLAEFIGILGGMYVAQATINLHPARYIHSVWAWLALKDVYISLLKGAVFGVLIALVCATQGYTTTGGAKQVGISTTKSSILSTVYMLIADLIINLVFYIF